MQFDDIVRSLKCDTAAILVHTGPGSQHQEAAHFQCLHNVGPPYGRALNLTAHRKPEPLFDMSLFDLSWFGGMEIEASLHSLAHPFGKLKLCLGDFFGGVKIQPKVT